MKKGTRHSKSILIDCTQLYFKYLGLSLILLFIFWFVCEQYFPQLNPIATYTIPPLIGVFLSAYLYSLNNRTTILRIIIEDESVYFIYAPFILFRKQSDKMNKEAISFQEREGRYIVFNNNKPIGSFRKSDLEDITIEDIQQLLAE